MIFHSSNISRLTRGLVALVILATAASVSAQSAAGSSNPISKIARIFDSQLVKVEDRITWISEMLRSYPPRAQFSLKTGLGFRGCRTNLEDPDPSVTLDLGKESQIDSVSMIPAQGEFFEDRGMFPKRYSIELSNRADFGQRTILYTTSSQSQPAMAGYPVTFPADHTARYVRLTVHEGHSRGGSEMFALSEIFVISDRNPVSFNAKVTTVGASDLAGIWDPSAINDGRSPLGMWHNGRETEITPGDIFKELSSDEEPTWTIQIPENTPLDRIVLFPYQQPNSEESTIFPEQLTVSLSAHENDPGQVIAEWSNPLPGDSQQTPIVIPLAGQQGSILTLTSTCPWSNSDKRTHALSEIEVWSGGRNIASKKPVTRKGGGQTVTLSSLTDKRGSLRTIIPVGIWLQQLIDRGRIESELQTLRTAQYQLSSESELNATWGSAVVLGMTFLIPVFIVERKRLASQKQLETIRKRIASDLHDDIGSNLGSISLIARTARKDLTRLQGPEEIANDLNEVESIARESSLAMRDIVWLVERKQDSIGDLVERMQETASRLLREIRFNIECETSKSTARLTLDAKRHLFLFYKEAIHNILKHSGADTVTIRLWDESEKLALEIIDNGIGSMGKDGSPPKFRKLEDRARVLSGDMKIQTSDGAGTRILLLVKRSNLTSHPALT